MLISHFTRCSSYQWQDIQQKIVDKHNQLREMVASGKAKGMNGETLPAAKDMMELQWDDELAAGAQTYVNFCFWLTFPL